MVSQTIPVKHFDLTIFGASGDLAQRKILPSLYCRMRAGQFDAQSRIIGAARSDLSRTALQAHIANWRWAGVPFFLRTGKRLRKQLSEITIHFKKPPHFIFDGADDLGGNVLSYSKVLKNWRHCTTKRKKSPIL